MRWQHFLITSQYFSIACLPHSLSICTGVWVGDHIIPIGENKGRHITFWFDEYTGDGVYEYIQHLQIEEDGQAHEEDEEDDHNALI